MLTSHKLLNLLLAASLWSLTLMSHEANAGPQNADVHTASTIIAKANRAMDSGLVLGVDEDFAKAVAILEKHQPAENKLLVQALLGLGKSYSRAGKPQKSIPALERAAKVCPQCYGTNSEKYADINYWLGLSYAVTGQANKAIPLLEHSARIYEKVGNRSELGRNLADLADMYHAAGRTKDAEAAERKADAL